MLSGLSQGNMPEPFTQWLEQAQQKAMGSLSWFWNDFANMDGELGRERAGLLGIRGTGFGQSVSKRCSGSQCQVSVIVGSAVVSMSQCLHRPMHSPCHHVYVMSDAQQSCRMHRSVMSAFRPTWTASMAREQGGMFCAVRPKIDISLSCHTLLLGRYYYTGSQKMYSTRHEYYISRVGLVDGVAVCVHDDASEIVPPFVFLCHRNTNRGAGQFRTHMFRIFQGQQVHCMTQTAVVGQMKQYQSGFQSAVGGMAQGMAMMYLRQNIMETMRKTMDMWQAGNAVDDTCKALAEQSRYGDDSTKGFESKARRWTPAWIQRQVTSASTTRVMEQQCSMAARINFDGDVRSADERPGLNTHTSLSPPPTTTRLNNDINVILVPYFRIDLSK